LHNLAGDQAFEGKRKELRSKLDEMLVAEEDPRAMGNGAIFDTYRYLGGRSKGYETWERKQKGLPPLEAPKKKGSKQ
ncbi:MAG: heparan N-sulfatase, partial [Verrucomicrobiales bacterium]